MTKQNEDQNNDELIEATSWPEVFQNPKISKAVNTAVEGWANNLPKLAAFQTKALFANLVFGLLVLSIIGCMGYLKIISSDVAGSLIGSLIGYWYGRYQGGK